MSKRLEIMFAVKDGDTIIQQFITGGIPQKVDKLSARTFTLEVGENTERQAVTNLLATLLKALYGEDWPQHFRALNQ